LRVLIKLGGTLLDSDDSRLRLAREITQAAGDGYQIAVVHGGGKQMTRFLAERGVESRFVNGLRVTTPEIVDAVVKVFAGSVNTGLVAAFRAAGARPVGLTGLDAGLVDAQTFDPELGQVGKPVRSDAALLESLTAGGYLPVVACIAGDENGKIYNVNADQMAVACATAFQVDTLLFLTDVDGVRDGNAAVRPALTAAEATSLIDAGVATGGMQAKLESALEALRGKIAQVLIVPGAKLGIVGDVLRGEPLGTRLIA
jgi:acetylglutamate kinase